MYNTSFYCASHSKTINLNSIVGWPVYCNSTCPGFFAREQRGKKMLGIRKMEEQGEKVVVTEKKHLWWEIGSETFTFACSQKQTCTGNSFGIDSNCTAIKIIPTPFASDLDKDPSDFTRLDPKLVISSDAECCS